MSERVEITAELKDLISGRLAAITRQITAMDSSLGALNSSGGSGGRGGIMGQVLGANLLTSAISKAGSAVMDFAKGSFMAFGKAEQFTTSLTTMFKGNALEAKVLNQQLRVFALETPFELPEIRDATRMMIAYGSTSGGVVDEMRMLGNISSGVGSSLSEMAYLYGTLRTQGRAFSKDIYQFTGRGVPIIKELAKQFKVADSAVMKLVEDGKVGFKEVEKAMQSMTAEGGLFGGMMEKQSKTLLAQTGALNDAWTQLMEAMGQSQSGILKNTISWATQMVNAIKSVVESDNYREETRKGLPASMDLNKNFGAFDSKEDQRFRTNIPGAEKQSFKSKKDAAQYLLKSDAYKEHGTGSISTLGTKEVYREFADKMFEMMSTATAVNAQERLNELTFIRKDIMEKTRENDMSHVLAVNELAQVSANTKQLKEIMRSADLEKQKLTPQPTVKPLEAVAKANKAVQVIVNIENLVRELTNVNQKADTLNQLTTDGTLKALTVAVNNIYSAGQI